jgi:hypothetical protein
LKNDIVNIFDYLNQYITTHNYNLENQNNIKLYANDFQIENKKVYNYNQKIAVTKKLNKNKTACNNNNDIARLQAL